jgi:hypothetical protein
MPQYYYPILLGPRPADGEPETIRAWVDPNKYAPNASNDPKRYECNMKLMTHARSTPFVSAVEMLLTPQLNTNKCRLVWAGDYADNEPGLETNLYKLCKPKDEIVPEESDMSYYGFIVNHTKGQFISKERCEKYTNLHPLPLLTAEGNGCTDGDYPHLHKLVGYWARDELSVVKQRPRGLVEIIFDLA